MPAPDRVTVSIRPRSIAISLLLALAAVVAVALVWNAWRPISWLAIAAFLATGLNPLVRRLERAGMPRTVAAVGVFFAATAVVAGVVWLLVPPLVEQARALRDAIPDLLADLTAGRGPLGFLERDFNLVERAREALAGRPFEEKAIELAGAMAGGVLALVTIAFLTLFLLVEGPAWVERILALIPDGKQARARVVADDVYRMIAGYAAGNLLISGIAFTVAVITLLVVGVPYALPLALAVAVLDLVPLVGATVATALVSLVAFTDSTTAGVAVMLVFIVYQLVENHLLQPLVYGRTVQLSPVVIVFAVLVGAELDGVVGALAAIPVAALIQIALCELIALRRGGNDAATGLE